MEITSPWWVRTAENRPAPHAGLPSCSEYSKKTVQCEVETSSNGSKWKRCKEVQQQFRVCAGRPPEELFMTVVETLEPVMESEASTSGEKQEAPVTPEVGRLFDEFFVLASEIEKNLVTSGVLHPGNEGLRRDTNQESTAPSSGNFLQRLFGKRALAESRGPTLKAPENDLFARFASGPPQDV
ncbi:hypothetical protein CEUSTIGMA_g1724.t1 [Chlamydomonas eustigma]|uniref:Uncharacterized protein n=1 Tax=Chlamydomonas eustigma TaxID=1157962 RepID=A0A250WU02_9CHLO|nr:hypothetical protein CEUSTIGMA_g1724.t1 [Chlamydomonas eustigma]|eukprot:GAX74275.1 hypothetical protein CEUSTIGMA_g1724.t1 [Chlamydomonas eustigma]